jgi:serine/threonine protein kinase
MSTGPGADPVLGLSFRGYRIERAIASGGMGAVYLARDESLPNVCKVIKVLLAELAADESLRAFVVDRFEREALAVSVLRHDNIAAVHAVGKLVNGQPCMLMDFVEGQTLDDVIRSYKGRVPPYRAMHYLCHIARGLDFAHSLGIVHRDLKPSNIMVSPKDHDPYFCLLLDFGMAKVTRPISLGKLVPTMGGVGLGTPCFMSVEQFRHADEATALSDVYALAIIIWFMVTGELPWGPHDTSSPLGLSALYETQRDKVPNPPPPGTLPPGWERALRAALSPDPEQRPASVRHLMVDLANGLEPTGPHVKGGVQILRDLCPRFIAESAPDAETVRDQRPRTIVVAWPRLETPARAAVADIMTRPELPRRAQAGQPTPVTPVLGAPAPVAPVTTIGASNGMILPPSRTSLPRTRRTATFLAIGAASVTVLVLVLVAVRSGAQRPAAAAQPSPPIAAPPAATTPAATMPTAITPTATTPIATTPTATTPTATTPTATTPTATTPTATTPTTTAPTATTPAATTPAATTPAATTPAATNPPATTPTATTPAATTPAATTPTATAPATTTPARKIRPSSARKRGDEPRVQKPKFDPNAPASGEE